MAKLLLVEDDVNLREIYAARLLAQGYEVVTASDGEEALATAVKEKPDLILLDVMMPKISGFDVLDILRSTPETRSSKVVMMTALSQQSDRERGERLGADRYLVKSQVTLEDVVNTIGELLKQPENQYADLQASITPSTGSSPTDVSDSANSTNPSTSSEPQTPSQVSVATPGPSIDTTTSSEVQTATSDANDTTSLDNTTVTTAEPETSTSSEPVAEPSSTEPTPPKLPTTQSDDASAASSAPVKTDNVSNAAVPTVDVKESAPIDAAPITEPTTSMPSSEAPADANPTVAAPPSMQTSDSLTIHSAPPTVTEEPQQDEVVKAAPSLDIPAGSTADIESLPLPNPANPSETAISATSPEPISNSTDNQEDAQTEVDAAATESASPDQSTTTKPKEKTILPDAITSTVPKPSFPPDDPLAPGAEVINSSNPQPGETIVPTNPS